MDQRVTPPKPQPAVSAPDIAAALSLDKDGRAKPRRGRWLKWAALALVIAGAAYGYSFWSANSVVKVTYTSAPAAVADLVVEVSATGTLQPVTKVDVSSEQSGVVRAVNFAENQRVKKGDVLAELDTATLAAQVERAQDPIHDDRPHPGPTGREDVGPGQEQRAHLLDRQRRAHSSAVTQDEQPPVDVGEVAVQGRPAAARAAPGRRPEAARRADVPGGRRTARRAGCWRGRGSSTRRD